MVKLFVIFWYLALPLAVLTAQQDSVQSLYKNAQKAYLNKDYTTAIELYTRILALPATQPEWKMGIFYNEACCYSLLKDHEKAFQLLRRALEAGWTDHGMVQRDTDLDFLKEKDSGRFQALIREIESAAKKAVLEMSPIAVLEYDNYLGTGGTGGMIFDDYNDSRMDSLRNRYRLGGVVEPGTTEFGRMKLLLDWVATRWKHKGDNACKEKNALAILAAAERGERFACIDYAIALANCLNALGYPARWVGLRKAGEAFGNSKGHSCVEVWSDQYQKWILLDGQNNAWWEANSMPLSAPEIRRKVLSGRESDLTFAGQHKDVSYNGIQPEWTPYFHHLVYSANCAFFKKIPRDSVRILELIGPDVTPELFLEGWPENMPLTDDSSEVYPAFNRTAISFTHPHRDRVSDTLNVLLSHTMPYFEKFLVRIDGGVWQDYPSTFDWKLKEGENTLEARALSRAGHAGKPSRIVLRNNIGTRRR